jgi:hypothetical protein
VDCSEERVHHVRNGLVDTVALTDRDVRRHLPRQLLEDADQGLDTALGAGFGVGDLCTKPVSL